MLMEAEIVLLRDTLGGCDRASFEMDLEAEIKLNSEMHLEIMIERVWGSIWKLVSRNSEMHLEAMIDQVWRCS